MRRVMIRSLAITTVLGGIIFTGAGAAAGDPGSSAGVPTGPGNRTGGDNSSSTCGASDIDFAHGCFLGWGRFFK